MIPAEEINCDYCVRLSYIMPQASSVSSMYYVHIVYRVAQNCVVSGATERYHRYTGRFKIKKKYIISSHSGETGVKGH